MTRNRYEMCKKHLASLIRHSDVDVSTIEEGIQAYEALEKIEEQNLDYTAEEKADLYQTFLEGCIDALELVQEVSEPAQEAEHDAVLDTEKLSKIEKAIDDLNKAMHSNTHKLKVLHSIMSKHITDDSIDVVMIDEPSDHPILQEAAEEKVEALEDLIEEKQEQIEETPESDEYSIGVLEQEIREATDEIEDQLAFLDNVTPADVVAE